MGIKGLTKKDRKKLVGFVKDYHILVDDPKTPLGLKAMLEAVFTPWIALINCVLYWDTIRVLDKIIVGGKG